MHKLKYLDGLRGVAAITVVLNHFIAAFFPALYFIDNQTQYSRFDNLIAKTPLNLIYNGHFSVCVFFVLSGYVLSYKYFGLGQSKKNLVTSALKRYFRLTIPILFSLLLSYFLLKIDWLYNKQVSEMTGSQNWLGTFWNFTPSINEVLSQGIYKVIFKGINGYNPVLWTMKYEFFGSLLVFLFLFLFGSLKKKSLLYITLAIILWDSYYLAFFLGMILCDYRDVFKRSKLMSNKFYIIIISILAFYLASYPAPKYINSQLYHHLNFNFLREYSAQFYHIIAAFLLILVIDSTDSFKKLMSHKSFNFLGRISFSLYLSHMAVIGSLSSYLFYRNIHLLSYKMNFIVTFTLSFLVMIVISYTYYILIDKNSVIISNYLSKKLEKPLNKLN